MDNIPLRGNKYTLVYENWHISVFGTTSEFKYKTIEINYVSVL